jgi:hypothetical protein
MQRGMLRAIAAFRWGTWIWVAVVVFLHRDALARPVVAWALVIAALTWTVAATVLLTRNPDALRRAPAIVSPLVLLAAGIAGYALVRSALRERGRRTAGCFRRGDARS